MVSKQLAEILGIKEQNMSGEYSGFVETNVGPFFPRKPTVQQGSRTDGAINSPSGLAQGDMVSGASTGALNTAVPSIPAVGKVDDSARELTQRPTNPVQ